MVHVLAQSKPQIFKECKQNEMTILHRAAYDSNKPVIDLLLKEISFIDQVIDENDNQIGWTPFMLSAQFSDLNIMEALIKHGASPNQSLLNGTTALHYAAGNNQVPMLDYLIKTGMFVDVDV